MALRPGALLKTLFSKPSLGKMHAVLAVCALLGLTIQCQPGMAQSSTSHPPVISTSPQWTLGAPILASSDVNGVLGNGFSLQANLSPDGTRVLFWSKSTNLAPAATNGLEQLFLKDLTTGAISVVSADATGAAGNSTSSDPNNAGQILLFSPDGTKVVFESAASNLVAGGTNGHQHIFVKDLTNGSVTLVSKDANGIQGNGFSLDFSFSPDGTKVAFDSTSTNLIAPGTTGKQVFVKDLSSGAITLVSADGNGVMGNGVSSFPVFSPDGAEVAFISTSTNLAAGASNGHSEIYVKNLQTGAVTLESADANGNEANADSLYPMFSPDGSRLLFNSVSTNLVPNLPSVNSEVYVKDLASGAITLISADANGVPANGSTSMLAVFSPDATKIAFQSQSTNLVSGTNGAAQVFIKDLLTGAITLVSTSSSGVIGNSNSVAPNFSPGHTALAFESSAMNFGVNSFTSQVYTRAIFTASGAVADNPSARILTTAGQLAFSDPDTSDTHSTSVVAQAGDLGAITASVSKDTAGTGTGGVILWNYQVDESQLSALTAPATDNFTLTLTDSQGCIATTAIVVTALPHDFSITNTSNSTTSASASTSTSSCPTLSITTSPSSLTVTAGQTVSFTAAAIGSPSPTVQWQFSTDGGATFTNVSGSAATSTTLTFTASMSQNGNLFRAAFTNSSGTVMSTAATLTVNMAQSATALASSKGSTLFGQAVSFTVTVTAVPPGAGTPTGTVTFSDGNASIGTATLDSTGAASFTTSSLAVGTHSITASYAGDANFNPSSSSLSQTVSKDAATVTLGSSTNPSVFGQAVNFAVNVTAAAPGTGTPTGTITFSDGSASIGTATLDSTGAASFTISSLAVGTHSINASYGGDGNFNSGSSATLSQVVNKNGATMTLNSSANPSVFGQAVNFAVTVTAAAPGTATATGTVTLQDGSATLSTLTLVDGQVSFTTASLAVGSHSITAAYSGDSNLNAASSSLSQTVNQNATLLTLGSSANPSVFGQPVVLTAMVSAAAPGAGTPSGTISFQDGATSLGTANLNNGQASLAVSALSVGAHSIAATYSGDPNFTFSTASAAQTVNKASTTTTLSSAASLATLNQSVTFTATVKVVAPGVGAPTGTVTFSDGTTTLGTVSLSSAGTATFTTSSLAVKSHSITAAYSGDGNFNGSSGVLTQNVQYGICAQYDQSRSVQSGATFPIKLQLCDAARNNLSSSSIILHATAVVAASGISGPPQDSGNANPDNDFRFSGGSGQNSGYIFNLSTNGLQTGTYALQFMVSGDPIPHSVLFGVQ